MTGRQAALEILTKCRKNKAWAAPSLDALIRDGGLDPREAALASQLSLGVLQNQDLLDFYLDHFCSGKLHPQLRDLLRLGAYQILFMDRIPDRAAVSESVSLSRETGFSKASGLINAVLRRLSENRNDLPPIPGEGTGEYLSIRYSLPRWLTDKLIAQRGYAFTEAFLARSNEPGTLDLQINTLCCTTEEYSRALDRMAVPYGVPSFPKDCLTLPGGRVNELPGFEEGLFYVQDRAARMAVEIAEPKPGMRVLDACAAPGGKSFAAALLMSDRGAVLAHDIHPNKLERIRKGALRLHLNGIHAAVGDARKDDPKLHGAFDLVIADLPCSGFGVIRKKPEIRFKEEKAIAGLPTLQREMLETLSSFVKPGGTLLYSTCTVLREENEDVINGFLLDHPEFVPADFTVGERSSHQGCYTFWPHIDGTDGFFAAKLRRADS